MGPLNLKPASAAIKAYYAALKTFSDGGFVNEGNVRGAFEDLLKKCARHYEWNVIPEYRQTRKGKNPISIDAALLDVFNLPRGFWEAKDLKDNLEAAMKEKFEAGYPRSNILFQRPDRALLFQDGRIVFNDSIAKPEELVHLLHLFFEWRQPHQEDWDRAVQEFSEHIPRITEGSAQSSPASVLPSEARTPK